MANPKRIHFIKEILNINSDHEYSLGIKTFKNSLIKDYEEYKKMVKENNFYISIEMSINSSDFSIKISNNNKITTNEIEIIKNLQKMAIRFTSLKDIISIDSNSSESKGLGIIIISLMLKQLGLFENNLQIYDKLNETIAEVIMPLNLINNKEAELISKDIINEINEIPQFPKYITEIPRLLDDPESNFEIISEKIKKDPSLIADLIKIANSPLYLALQRIDLIDEAIKIIGFKNMQDIIIRYTTNKIFINKYSIKNIKGIISHSNEVSYYCVEIARILKIKNILEKVLNICKEKGINTNTLESLTNGYNHSIIGSELAKKWNFPDFIQESIKYHHIPLDSSEENQIIVSITYFSDHLYHYKRKEIDFENFNFNVLKKFNLIEKKDFYNFCDSVILKYENRPNKK